jgi:osmotically-inducible protein OsmY
MQPTSTTWPASSTGARTTGGCACASENVEGNRLMERAAKALLAKSGYQSLSDIECKANGGILSLHGRVNFYYHKQVAQEIASRVTGVRRVHNDIDVLE